MIYSKENLAISQFCGDESRPVLNGVAFYHNKTVATDSYMLAEVTTPKIRLDEVPEVPNTQVLKYLKDEPVIIPKGGVEKIAKNLPSKTSLPVLSNCWFGSKTSDELAEVISTDLETATPIIVKRVSGEFPAYQQVIPSEKPKVSININPALLMKVSSYLAKLGLNICEFQMFADDKPIQIKAEKDGQKFRFLIMPIKKG